MRSLLKIAVAGAIVTSTYYAIVRIAEHKADALAGGGTYLVDRNLPFPDLDIPEEAQRTFARIRLAGTLFHEIQHHEGVEDEGDAYEREMAWYQGLGERAADRLEGEQRRWFDWAVASALDSAAAAREKATGAPDS